MRRYRVTRTPDNAYATGLFDQGKLHSMIGQALRRLGPPLGPAPLLGPREEFFRHTPSLRRLCISLTGLRGNSTLIPVNLYS